MTCLQVRSMIEDFCPNYDIIVNYVDNNPLTKEIINDYREFLTINNSGIDIHYLDFVIGEYIKDENFYDFVHLNYKEKEEVFSILLDELLLLYKKYYKSKYSKIVCTKWL